MATFDVPADLVQLRRDFVAADAAWGDATDRDTAQEAYQKAGSLAEAIQDHPWWGECGGNRFEARMALLAAARVG
jgi:hypothetical protein